MRTTEASLSLRAFAVNWFDGSDSEMFKLANRKPFDACKLYEEAVEVLAEIGKQKYPGPTDLKNAAQLIFFARSEKKAEQDLKRLAKAAKVCHDSGWLLSEVWDAVKDAWQ